MRKFRIAVTAAFCAIAVLTTTVVVAEPPDHAKAHGWRKKNDPNYVGYTGRKWERDYGVLEGTCNRKEIGTALGAVVGGAIGSQVGDGSDRTVAIIVGAVVGAAIGREIGKELDEGDRACVGHALELAKAGQKVRWINETTGVTYVISPQATTGKDNTCRSYTLTMTHAGKSKAGDAKACRAQDGTWKQG